MAPRCASVEASLGGLAGELSGVRPSTVPLDRHDKTDLSDSTDSVDHALATHPAEKADSADPAEPTDRIEPAEPIDSTEPTEPIDRNDPFEPMLRTESSDPTDHSERRGSFTLSFSPAGRFSRGRQASSGRCPRRIARLRIRVPRRG